MPYAQEEVRVAIETMMPNRVLRRLRAIALLVLACSFGGFAGMAHAGYAAIVVDGNTGKVLEQVNADQRDFPASLTKMMTLYLTFKELKAGKLRLDEPMPVSAWAANKEPTKLGLRAGQTVSVQDCIMGMVTKSANDAATVMGEGIGGTEPDFAKMMNAQAALLGMTETHFDNASGLPDPNNYSTARDLVKLAMALYRDFPQYAHFFATQEFVFRGHIVRGHNHLMYRYPGMDGLKTGFTDASGFNLASTAVRDGRRLFGVVLGGRTAALRDNLMARLLTDGFDNQPTPPILVAEAAGMGTRMRASESRGDRARRVLRAMSPIQTAEADTIPASRRRISLRQRKLLAERRNLAAVRSACKVRRSLACRRAEARAHKAPARYAVHRPKSKKDVMVASRRQTNEG